MTDDNNQFHENSDAVQAHLGISQSVIQRMATNSASCKGWCIAIVPSGSPAKAFVQSLLSFSVWPFYLMLFLMVGIAWKYVL